MRDLDVIDSELRLVAALRRAALERGGPLPAIHRTSPECHIPTPELLLAGETTGRGARVCGPVSG